MAGNLGSVVKVSGLRELDRAFRKMSKDVREEFVRELQEAAEPVRKFTTAKLLADLVNLPKTPSYADMRIGVSVAETMVYIVPAWRTGGAYPSKPRFGVSISKRMDLAVEAKSKEVEDRIDQMLGRMASDWGSAI